MYLLRLSLPLVLLVVSLLSFPCRAQQPAETATENARQQYYRALGSHAPLYTGLEYVPGFNRKLKGHPYFQSKDWHTATVTFDGVTYPGIPLIYDIAHDAMIIGHAGMAEPLQKFIMVPERVQRVEFDGKVLVYQADSGRSALSGIYQLLHLGKTSVLVKRKKIFVERPTEITFTQNDKYFLFKDGQFHAVKNLNSFLKLFPDYRKELTVYLREQDVVFNKEKEKAMVLMAAKYEALVK